MQRIVIPLLAVLLLSMGMFWRGFEEEQPTEMPAASPVQESRQGSVRPNSPEAQAILASRYASRQTRQWGEKVTGVAYRLDTQERVLALTLDACGGSGSAAGFDQALIDYLVDQQIPATLFVSGVWIDANPEVFKQLASNPLFEIGNHGMKHLPASISGQSAYGIKGSSSPDDLIVDIVANDRKIAANTGTSPRFYRSGTDYYDEAAVMLTADLGYAATGYTVAGDGGATFSCQQVKKALLAAQAGSIILMHFNHPEGQSAEGLIDAVPVLKHKGFRFVRLSDYSLAVYP